MAGQASIEVILSLTFQVWMQGTLGKKDVDCGCG